MRKAYIALFLIFSIMSIVSAQVFETERGKIEFLGLKKWDAQTLLDSMKYLSPNKPIHACAGQMKSDFGFTDVCSYFHIKDYNDLSTLYSVVTIIEDNIDGKIIYLKRPVDSLALLKQYRDCADILNNNPSLYFAGIQTYHLYKEGNIDSAKNSLATFSIKSKEVMPFWEYLLSKKNIDEMNLALWVLNNDLNLMNRKVALAILLNFSNYDSIWWTVLNLQRFKDSQLSSPAISTLRALGKSPRKVNWGPATASIINIINGTNLFAFQITLEILTKTEISPELANSLLKNSSELIISYLNAKHDITREVAIKFIQQVSGEKDLKNSNDCKMWLTQYVKN